MIKCLRVCEAICLKEGRIRIICLLRPDIFTREKMLFFLFENDLNDELAERYKRFYADIWSSTC